MDYILSNTTNQIKIEQYNQKHKFIIIYSLSVILSFLMGSFLGNNITQIQLECKNFTEY